MRYLHELAAANYHHPGLRAAQVGECPPDLFQLIRADVDELTTNHPPSTVETGHITGWVNPVGVVNQWSLYNSHGDTSNTSDDFNYSNLAQKRIPGFLAGIAEFAASLPDLVNMRLNVMHPGAALSPHEEHLPRKVGSAVGLRARFHLPVFTNPDAVMMADGDEFHFQEGNVYVFNNGCVHSARNGGNTPRAHLVWDQLMTETAYQTMFSNLQPLEVEGVAEIDGYATQAGMSEAEFNRRVLVYT